MNQYQITVNLKVAQVLVDDGFDPTNENWLETFRQYFEEKMLPYAETGEVKAEIHTKKLRRKQTEEN